MSTNKEDNINILILGATGNIGKDLVLKCLSENYNVSVLVRNPEKIDNNIMNKIKIFKGEINNKEIIKSSLENIDIVISTIGPSTYNHSSNLPITEGYKILVESMEEMNVKRLIALSTPSFYDENDKRFSFMGLMIPIFKLISKNTYNEVNGFSIIIKNSNLEWTLVRVPELKDGNPNTKINVGYIGEVGITLYRKDFVLFCIDEIKEKKWIKKAPAISSEVLN